MNNFNDTLDNLKPGTTQQKREPDNVVIQKSDFVGSPIPTAAETEIINNSNVLNNMRETPTKPQPTASKTVTEPLILDSVTFNQLRKDCGDVIFKEFIDEFYKTGRNKVDDFKKASQVDDFEKMAFISHNLKASAAIMGFTRLSQLCHKNELACKKLQPIDPLKAAQELELAVKQAIDTLANVLGGVENRAKQNREELLARTAHDLRNDLNIIIGCLSLMQEDEKKREKPLPKLVERSSIMQEASINLNNKIQKMLSTLLQMNEEEKTTSTTFST
ncbi:MAG: Hpt domain-containing protein [Magnetococcales bacterium]|nr:Hpt domain-containing protein [Magnetococcales bacterium]